MRAPATVCGFEPRSLRQRDDPVEETPDITAEGRRREPFLKRTPMVKFYVYLLIDGRTDVIFYVGKGSGKRMYKHVVIARGNSVLCRRNPKLYNKIKSILANGSEVKYRMVLETDDEQEALNKEVETIKFYGLENLTNLTEGGEGTSFPRGFTEEHRRRISEAKKGKTHKGVPRSPETREKIRVALQGRKPGPGRVCCWKGKRLPEEMKRKMSEAHKGKKFSLEHRANLSKALSGKSHPWMKGNKGRIPWNKGKKTSEESRRKISKALKGKARSIECRAKISRALAGRTFPHMFKQRAG